MNLKFSGRGLAFLAHFKADNDIRYYLNGVCFLPLPADAGGGVIGAATNGHILGMWHDREAVCDRTVIATITRPLVMACKKPGAQLEAIGGRLVVSAYQKIKGELKRVEELSVQPNRLHTPRDGVPAWEIEGKFPNVLRVVREREHYSEGPTGEFQPSLLGIVVAALKDATPREQRRFFCGVTMRQHNKDSGMLVVSANMPEALAILMPRREDPGAGAPWLEAWRRHGTQQELAAAAPLPGRQPSDAVPPADFAPQRFPSVAKVRGTVRG